MMMDGWIKDGGVGTLPKIGASVVSWVGKKRRQVVLIKIYRGKCEIEKINTIPNESIPTAELAEW